MFIKHILTFTLVSVTGLVLAKSSGVGSPCGLKIAPCGEGLTCVPDDPTCASEYKCTGRCAFTNQYPLCGGNTPFPQPGCDKGSTCQDDPRRPESCGMACDAQGICIPDNAPFCGGIAGFQCPQGLFCYDILHDGCDVNNGGADCGGICL